MRWVIPVAVAVLIVPWLAFAWTRPDSPVPTLVAIPAEAEGLSAPIATSFSTAPFFVLVDLGTLNAQTIRNPNRSPGALGIKAAHRLLSKRVGALLTPELRPEPLNLLSTRGVRLFKTPVGSVSQAMEQLARGALGEVRALPPNLGQTTPSAQAFIPESKARFVGDPPAQVGSPTVLVSELGIEVASAPRGIIVASVTPHSRAARAGIRAGDLIVSVNRVGMNGVAHLQQFAALLPAQLVPTELQREGTRGEVWIPP